MPVTLADKLKSIGVSDAFAQRALNGRLTLPQQALLTKLLVAGTREAFAIRAIERGLTDADIVWNQRLGRPAAWLETQEPDVEVERRADWTRRHPGP